jgi:hypothetical protein
MSGATDGAPAVLSARRPKGCLGSGGGPRLGRRPRVLGQNDALPRAADAAIRKLLVANRFVASVVTCRFLTGVRLQHDDEEVVRGSFDDLVEILPS